MKRISNILYAAAVTMFLCGSMLRADNNLPDTLVFVSPFVNSSSYKVTVIVSSAKTANFVIVLFDSAGTKVKSMSVSGKNYGMHSPQDDLVDFPVDVFTCGFECPLAIYIEKSTRRRLYIDNEGCFTDSSFNPAMFGIFYRIAEF